MHMKRKLAIMMAIVFAVGSLTGCGSSSPEAEETTQETPNAESAVESETEETAEPTETGELTLYYSNSTEWADPIIQEFEDQTGI